MSFWTIATTEQRLAQIDGAIECGLTMRQVAINCGTTRGRIEYFASKHGRTFAANHSVGTEAAKDVNRMREARKHGAADVFMTGAFEIFPSKANERFLNVSGDE